MSKLVFEMMQSLDGYVDGVDGGLALPPRALRSIIISQITSAVWPAACMGVGCTRSCATGTRIDWSGTRSSTPLVDEYRLYFRPFVLGGGKPYFAGARPPLRLIATDHVGEDAVRLTYVPA